MADRGGLPVRCRGRRDFVMHSRIGMLCALNRNVELISQRRALGTAEDCSNHVDGK
jgi:hypothetical protein